MAPSGPKTAGSFFPSLKVQLYSEENFTKNFVFCWLLTLHSLVPSAELLKPMLGAGFCARL